MNSAAPHIIKMHEILPLGSSITARLEAYSCPDPNSGCWLWVGSTDSKGYGNLSVRGRVASAHRASYEEFRGSIPKGMCVLHRCDTPACINPEHLFLGTHQDNMGDMAEKGRAKTGRALLTKEHVLEIVGALSSTDRSYRDIASDYGVMPGAIWAIGCGVSWSSVTGITKTTKLRGWGRWPQRPTFPPLVPVEETEPKP